MHAGSDLATREIHMRYLQDDNVCVVHLVEVDRFSGSQAIMPVVWTGSSKRDPVDPPDLQVGFDIAYARALRKLAKHHDRQAQSKVKQADNTRLQRLAHKKDAKSEGALPTSKSGIGPDGTNVGTW